MNQKSKTKLCLILFEPVVGGNENFMLNLVNHLDRKKFDILFILFNRQGENAGWIPNDIKTVELGLRQVPNPHELSNVQVILKLSGIFRSFRPHVILSTAAYPNLVTILAKTLSGINAKVIIREITTRTKLLAITGRHWYQFKRWVYRRVYPLADLVVAPSSSIFADLKSFIPLDENRFRIIPNFVNEQKIRHNLNAPWQPERYGLRLDRPVILSVARLTKEKGIDLGLTAFAQTVRRHPCYYWVIGNGPEGEHLKQLAQDLGILDLVSFLGYQENPHLFLKHATIFLLPSYFEGFPNALLEAMYLGIPCVVNQYDDSIGDFLEDGYCGLLSKQNDATSMAQAINSLIVSPGLCQQLRQRAQEKINENHVDTVVVKQFEELLIRSAELKDETLKR